MSKSPLGHQMSHGRLQCQPTDFLLLFTGSSRTPRWSERAAGAGDGFSTGTLIGACSVLMWATGGGLVFEDNTHL